jgi:hypothetical protein
LDLPVESDKLYNPRGLSEKDVSIARLQEQAGTSNDFTQRLENIETGVPLIDIKNEQTSYETELKKLRTALNDDTLYKEEKKAIDSKHADRKSMAKEDVKSARLRKPQRATIVVEPVVRPTGAAAVAPRTPPVGAGEEKHADEGSGSDEEDVNFRTPQKGTIEYHKRLDKLEEISIMLSKPEFTEKTFNNARKLFSEADIHVSNNVKTQQGLAKVYNKRIITLENRGDIEKDQFPILDLKRRRK